MKSNLTRILTFVVAVLAIIGVALFIRVAGVDDSDTVGVSDAVSPLVTYSLFLLIASVVIAVVASLWSMLKNPAALKKTLLGLGVLAVVLAIAYFSASDELVMGADGVLAEKGSISKWVGTGIIYSLILGGIGLLFFVYDLIKGLVK